MHKPNSNHRSRSLKLPKPASRENNRWLVWARALLGRYSGIADQARRPVAILAQQRASIFARIEYWQNLSLRIQPRIKLAISTLGIREIITSAPPRILRTQEHATVQPSGSAMATNTDDRS